MLGRLARWLRFLGHDVEYERAASDDGLLLRARTTGRLLLTRDVVLARRAAERALLVRSLDPDDQLVEVVEALGLRASADLSLSRCAECNAIVEPIARDALPWSVPEEVRERHERFWRCPGCARVYWEGSHHAQILARLARFSNDGT